MARLIKHISSGLLLMLSGMPVSQALATTTDIKANIADGSCQVSLDQTSISFSNQNTTQFATGTAQILPLAVTLDCTSMQGQTPALSVTGESSGLNDAQLFRAASSTAKYAGFMLKKGTLTNLSDFYNAAGTVAPDDTVTVTGDNSALQLFSVGLVHSNGDPMPTAGAVSARITFAFIFP